MILLGGKNSPAAAAQDERVVSHRKQQRDGRSRCNAAALHIASIHICTGAPIANRGRGALRRRSSSVLCFCRLCAVVQHVMNDTSQYTEYDEQCDAVAETPHCWSIVRLVNVRKRSHLPRTAPVFPTHRMLRASRRIDSRFKIYANFFLSDFFCFDLKNPIMTRRVFL